MRRRGRGGRPHAGPTTRRRLAVQQDRYAGAAAPGPAVTPAGTPGTADRTAASTAAAADPSRVSAPAGPSGAHAGAPAPPATAAAGTAAPLKPAVRSAPRPRRRDG